MALHFQDGKKTEFAKTRRKEPTEAESLLWSALRNRKLAGYKFRREAVIDPYVVDFLCQEQRLIVEVDGSSHDHRGEYDLNRERELGLKGYSVIRFSHQNVMANLLAVIKKKEKCLKEPDYLAKIQSK